MDDTRGGGLPARPPGQCGRIVVVDDHPLIRQGLCGLIGERADLEVCGTAEGARDGLQLILEHQPDVAIVDIGLQDGDGIDVTRRIQKLSPGTRVLIVSVFAEPVYARQAIAAGASGFISKVSALDEMLAAIRCVLAGETYLGEDLLDGGRADDVDGRQPSGNLIKQLSMRELQVFKAIGEGMSTVAIASYLGIGVKTVETHRANIRRKLHLSSAHELKECAMRWSIKAQG